MNIQGINPAMYAPVQAQNSAVGVSARPMDSSGTSSSGNGLSAGDLQSTFLNLLVTELQNQDPTQPVSPTDMVGQMVSLNQLDQLISINEILGAAITAGGTGTGTGGSTTTTGGPQSPSTGGANSTSTASQNVAAMRTNQPISTSNTALAQAEAAAAAQNFNPVVYPANLMNLYGNVGANSNLSIGGGR
jgi:flagellar basal-body rod modification protein FlgD